LPIAQSTYPNYLSPNGWNALLPKRVIRDDLPATPSCATIVVGAGYTGLAAARRLAELEPGREIVLFEASEVGEGAAGRNSGFLSIHPNEPLANGRDSVDAAAARQIRLYREGRNWLKSLIARHHIDCGFDETSPRILGAATAAGEQAARRSLVRNRMWGLEVEEFDQARLIPLLGTDYYRYGIRIEGHALVQPAALVRGLADALPAEVRLVERTPVERIEGSGPFVVQTSRGRFKADRLLITNNVHARTLGLLRDRMIAIYTYAGLTPELEEAELARHGGLSQWGLIPAHAMGTTMRKFEGGRLLFRSGDSYERELPPDAIGRRLIELYRHRYPALASHAFEHVWGGVTAITRNGGLYFGQPRRGLFCAAGCNGSGVVRGSINGRLLAEMAAGSQSPLLTDRLALRGPSWIPPDPLRSIVVRTQLAIGQRSAGPEC
jgi:glycine/D-amino acid oxidase-like deaminating enzyme